VVVHEEGLEAVQVEGGGGQGVQGVSLFLLWSFLFILMSLLLWLLLLFLRLWLLLFWK
jgi:hypothetical protein